MCGSWRIDQIGAGGRGPFGPDGDAGCGKGGTKVARLQGGARGRTGGGIALTVCIGTRWKATRAVLPGQFPLQRRPDTFGGGLCSDRSFPGLRPCRCPGKGGRNRCRPPPLSGRQGRQQGHRPGFQALRRHPLRDQGSRQMRLRVWQPEGAKRDLRAGAPPRPLGNDRCAGRSGLFRDQGGRTAAVRARFSDHPFGEKVDDRGAQGPLAVKATARRDRKRQTLMRAAGRADQPAPFLRDVAFGLNGPD